VRLSQGRTEQGIEDLERQTALVCGAGDQRADLRGRTAAWLVPALTQTGREQQAREFADEALRVTRDCGVARYIADAVRARALAQAGGANLDELRQAASIYERIGSPYSLARTLLDIGAVMRRRRRRVASREPLRRALDLARGCRMRAVAERAERELRAAGARPRRDRITGRDALTASEQRIAKLAIEGMTNRQIAETQFITRKTVESHLEHIFRKLDIHARGELQQALAAQAEGTAAT
jgi:DNA-binding CsgD family transcriptional regulator